MAMGVVDNDVLERELTSLASPCHNSPTPNIVEMPNEHGRNKGDNNVPSSLRKIIGETSEIEGRAEALKFAKSFDISPSSVSAYANGSKSTKSYHSRESEILQHINNRKLNISNKASKKLIKALDAMTDEKLHNAKLVELASVMNAASAVVKSMEPETKNENNNSGVQFIVYAPQILSEDRFQTIDLNE
jgi:hypothetical protein